MSRSIVNAFYVCLVVVVFISSSGSANILYVTPSGSSSTWSNPYHSIQSAINAAVNGDQIWVAGGTYNEYLNITQQKSLSIYGGFAGNAGETLAQRDWINNKTIINCQDANGNAVYIAIPSKPNGYPWYGQTYPVTFDGFAIYNADTAIACYSPATISHNVIGGLDSDVSTGIYGSDYADINSINPEIDVVNNIISHTGTGIRQYWTTGLITNNTLAYNGLTIYGAGIEVGPSAVTVANNIVAYNYVGLFDQEFSGQIINNCFYGNGMDADDYDPIGTDGNISADPCFVDSQQDDYHLQPNSPCIDAGADSVVGVDQLDIDGQPRQVNVKSTGSLVDIGADEYIPLKVTINQAQGQNDPTNINPVNFTVTFSEAVTGFTADDVTLDGVTGATATVTGSGTTYNVAVSLPSSGTVFATVHAGVVQDNSGVWNYEATHTDNSVLFDNVGPSAPSNVFLDLLVTGTNKLHAKWDAPSDPDLAGYDYKITYLDFSNNENTQIEWTAYSSTEVTRSLALSALGKYTFHVRAKDTLGNVGPEASNLQWVQSTGGRVGFLYDLCYNDPLRDSIHGFLIDDYVAFSSDMVYPVDGHVSWSDPNDQAAILQQLNSWNVVFLVLPQRALTTAENNAMVQFANGFQKRIVFVGDRSYYSTQNDYLNSAMASQGMSSVLWGQNNDGTKDYNRHCTPIAPGNYLTQGVSYLWDWGCGGMNNLNAMFLTSDMLFLAGTDWKSGQPDMKRIVISDRDVLNREFGPNSTYNPSHSWESSDHANGRFIANLCSKWQ